VIVCDVVSSLAENLAICASAAIARRYRCSLGRELTADSNSAEQKERALVPRLPVTLDRVDAKLRSYSSYRCRAEASWGFDG
jgi:hypothetical protein